jgi:hypothetical protein
MGAACLSVLIECSSAGLPLASSFEHAASDPSINACRGTDNRNSLFIFTIPLAYWLAGAFSRAGVKSVGRQTARLKRLQIERKTRGRNDDDFKVG